jgi:hypothetical protein
MIAAEAIFAPFDSSANSTQDENKPAGCFIAENGDVLFNPYIGTPAG